jgi:hypothetical protein
MCRHPVARFPSDFPRGTRIDGGLKPDRIRKIAVGGFFFARD